MNTELRFNELPRPTFRWLKVNHTDAQLTTEATGRAQLEVVSEGAAVVEPLQAMPLLAASYAGANGEALQAVAENFTEGYHIRVPAGATGKVVVKVGVDGEAVAERIRVRAEVAEGAALTLVYYMNGDTTAPSQVQLLTELATAEAAKVDVRKVQLFGSQVQQIEHRYIKLEKEATAEYTSVEIGGKENFLNFEDVLEGDASEIKHDLAYLGDKEQRFDISMLMSHLGKKTVSDIHNLGALDGVAKKSFRGTLDFIKGSMGAEGAEEDICLLLNPKVKSVSLPLLLCKEDNVVGNHAASAGQIDQNKLFYLMSRGFSEAEAKHIIVESMLRPVIDKIGDEEMAEAALTMVRYKI